MVSSRAFVTLPYCLLLLGLLLSAAKAQALYNYGPPTRALHNSNFTAPIVTVAPLYAKDGDVCSHTLYVFTNASIDSTNCLFKVSITTQSKQSLGCPSQLRGVTQANCYSDGKCIALNTQTRNLVLFNSSGYIHAFGGNETLVSPSKMLVVGTAAAPEAKIVDNGHFYSIPFISVSLTVVEKFIYDAKYVLTEFSTKLTNDSLAGIGITADPIYVIAYAGQSNYSRMWNNPQSMPPETLPYDMGGFGAIELFASHNRQAYIYDSTCKCMYIINFDYATFNLFYLLNDGNFGRRTSVVNFTSPITSLVNTQDYVYLVDSTGVLEISHVAQISVTVNPTKCQNKGSVNLKISKGVLPLLYYVVPYAYKDRGFMNNTIPPGLGVTQDILIPDIKPLFPVLQDYIIFDDAAALNIDLMVGNAEFEIVNSTVFAPHSGNTSMKFKVDLAWPFYNVFDIYWVCKVGYCMDPALYKSLEFYIYIDGDSIPLTIDLLDVAAWHHTVQQSIEFLRGDLAPKTWHKISFSLEGIQFAYYQLKIGAVDSSPLNSTFYIDDVKLIAYTEPQYAILVHDACGVNRYYNFTIDYSTAFTATIKNDPQVTCNAAGINPEKSHDAFVSLALENGVEPFFYKWNYPGVNQDDTLTNVSSSTSFITIYSDALNTSWADGSSAPSIILYDDSIVAHSGKYSFSFAPTEDLTLFNFISPIMLNSERFSVVEFWVNGGAIGGQTINLVVFRYTKQVAVYSLESLLNVNFVPANMWLKARLEIPSDVTYNAISLQADGDYPQPRIYFDDLVLLSKTVAGVVDNNGCITLIDRVTVRAPPPLLMKDESENLRCFKNSDGIFAVNLTGGQPPYTFTWTLPTGEQVVTSVGQLSGLNESEITLEVADANGCEVPVMVSAILQPPELQLVTQLEPIKCHGGLAKVSASAVGGVGPYTYSWVSTTSTFVSPTSAPSPIFTDSLEPQFTITNAATECRGTGFAIGDKKGGSPTHSGYCSLFPNFTAGPVSIKCPSCSKTTIKGMNFWIFIQNANDIPKISVEAAMALGGLKQSLKLTQLNGTIYEGAWSELFVGFPVFEEVTFVAHDLSGTVILDDIVLLTLDENNFGKSTYPGFVSKVQGGAGRYFVSATDSNGCITTFDIPVTEPSEMQVYTDISYPTTNSTSDGSVTIQVTGGVAPYTYMWLDSGVTSATLNGISTGEYVVKVTDSNGCFIESRVKVLPSTRVIRAYNRSLSGGLGALVAIGAVVAIFAAVMLAMYWTHFSVLGSFFCAVLLCGVLIGYVAALVLLPRPTDTLCTAFPWLLGIAFILVYGCLFIKTWALYQVWRAAKEYRKTSLTPMKIVRLLGIALLIEIIFLIVWTIIDPPTARLVKVVNNNVEVQCETDHPTFWIIFLVVKGTWLIFGAVLSVLTRDIVKKYNESTSISYAIYNIVVLGAIGIPLGVLLKEVPGGRLVICVVITVLAFTFTMCIMFFKYWYNALVRASPTLSVAPSARSTNSLSKDSKENSKNSKGSKDSKESKSSAVSKSYELTDS